MVLRVIGIDIGTSLGWARIEDGRHIESGQVDLRPHSWEGVGMRAVRARQTVDAVVERARAGELGAIVVAIELVRRHAGTQAAQIYGAILGAVTGRCEELGVPYTFVAVQEAKLAATERGVAEKASMVAAALQAFGVAAGEDQADAIWIAAAAGLREGDPTAAPRETPTERGKREARERAEAKRAASAARKASAGTKQARKRGEAA